MTKTLPPRRPEVIAPYGVLDAIGIGLVAVLTLAIVVFGVLELFLW